jgi:hypothetical protein
MDFQVKFFNWQDPGNHLIIVGRGGMDTAAFSRLFGEIAAATQHLNECKVLVDLSDCSYMIGNAEIDALVAELPLDRWPPGNKLAFVSALGTFDYHRLYYLRVALAACGLALRVFRDSKVAIDWLARAI